MKLGFMGKKKLWLKEMHRKLEIFFVHGEGDSICFFVWVFNCESW